MLTEHWEYYQTDNGQWRSRFVAANGKILFVASEDYHNQADMLHAIDLLEIAVKASTLGNGSVVVNVPRELVIV